MKKIPSKQVLIFSGNGTFWLWYKFLIFSQKKSFSYISGNRNPKIESLKKDLYSRKYLFKLEKFKKKIHPEKMSYTSRNRCPVKTSYLFSKERFSYISENGNPETELYFILYILFLLHFRIFQSPKNQNLHFSKKKLWIIFSKNTIG